MNSAPCATAPRRRITSRLLFLTLLAFAVCCRTSAFAESLAVESIASLSDPAKLATLGVRGANPRVQKIVYWLATARSQGDDPARVADAALARIGWQGSLKGAATKAAFLRNLDIAERLGCLDAEGLENMRGGRTATIRTGPYAGDRLSVDHIIPRSVVPELDNVLANLELMPLKLNHSFGSFIGARQLDAARKLTDAGLLTAEQAARLKSTAHAEY